MKPNLSTLIAGIVLITLGGIALANEAGYLQEFSSTTLAWILAIVGAVFLAIYFMRGTAEWGWLFPACIFSAVAASLFMAESTSLSNWIPTLIIGSVAVPFVVAFILDRKRRWALNLVFILGAVALIPPLSNQFSSDLIAGYIVAIIGLQFILTYFLEPKAWWGIIPGGILVSIALMMILDSLLPDGMSVVAMFLGWMITFGLVWLRQGRKWAKAVTIVMGVLACAIALSILGMDIYWSLGLIGAGLVLVLLSLRPRKSTESN